MPKASLVFPPSVPRSCMGPLAVVRKACSEEDSVVAKPTIWPELLIAVAVEKLPPWENTEVLQHSLGHQNGTLM
jgi:hypothetical protein